MEYGDRERETRKRYATVRDLRLAVLKGEYHEGLGWFSRGLLWRTVCLGGYGADLGKRELAPVPHEKEIDLSARALLDDESANGGSMSALEVIRLDVDRLMIDPIFQEDAVKGDIVEILYNYDKFTPYKQGFHEICGLVYLQLKANASRDTDLKLATFSVFSSLMLSVVVHFYNEGNLIDWCTSNFNRRLRLVDPLLYDLLVKTHNIESQIWLIRWVRLIFIRELGIENTVKIIDYLLCFDHDLSKLIPFIIIVLLIKIKTKLIECEDSGEILHLLLHYPHISYTDDEIHELIDLSIKLSKSPESKLETYGRALNKKYSKHINWDRIQDLDRVKMELRLQRRVKGMLKRK